MATVEDDPSTASPGCADGPPRTVIRSAASGDRSKPAISSTGKTGHFLTRTETSEFYLEYLAERYL
jgi:hypothetical protein